jgi:4-amino-4-deoxy-L-arabinose transferase-like glycosyltransferase
LTRRRAVLVGLLLAASLTQSIFFAWALVPDPEEEMYMYLGKLALTGRISLFQDELVGNRMPLPYYLAGLSQLAFPHSLIAARLFSAALGLACLFLVWRIATRLAGESAGILALLFAATQCLLIGYFDVVSYHSLASLLLLGALWAELCSDWPYRRLVAMALVSLLFFTRATVMLLIPAALVYCLWRARDARERALLVAIAVLPPLAFFATDVRHWKFLAYVPVFDRLAAAVGYVSNRGGSFEAGNIVAGENSIRKAVVLFARWYAMWIIASVGIVGAVFAARIGGRTAPSLFRNFGINVVGASVLYLAISQFLIMAAWKLDLAVGYFPQFAIAAAICLGHGVAVVLDEKRLGRRVRWFAGLAFSAFFVVAPAKSRPPTLPLAVSWSDPPVTALEGLAAELGRLIPRGAHVFHLGGPLGLYLAGIDPYLRQERGLVTLVATADDGRFARSGLWDLGDIRKWLTRDSDYAVIAPAVVEPYRGTTLEPGLALVDSLLSTHFMPVGVVRHYPASVYYVYRRAREPGR